MARNLSRRWSRPISEINMTPLIDLTFLLLITFIITFPFVQQGIPLTLPKAKADELPSDRKRTIAVDVQGNLYLDEQPCTQAELSAAMSDQGKRDPDVTVLVRADEGVPYGRVVGVLRILHANRLKRLALVTRPEGTP